MLWWINITTLIPPHVGRLIIPPNLGYLKCDIYTQSPEYHHTYNQHSATKQTTRVRPMVSLITKQRHTQWREFCSPNQGCCRKLIWSMTHWKKLISHYRWHMLCTQCRMQARTQLPKMHLCYFGSNNEWPTLQETRSRPDWESTVSRLSSLSKRLHRVLRETRGNELTWFW